MVKEYKLTKVFTSISGDFITKNGTFKGQVKLSEKRSDGMNSKRKVSNSCRSKCHWANNCPGVPSEF